MPAPTHPMIPAPTGLNPREMPPEALAYIAGMFDAVGTVRIMQAPNGALNLSLAIRHKVAAMPATLLRTFGGRTRHDGAWNVSGTKAALFIGAVRPYVKTYGPVLDLVLAILTMPRGPERAAEVAQLRTLIAARPEMPLTAIRRPARGDRRGG